ncbi:MAG: protein kinase [Thermoflexales bacterium]
MTTQTIGRYRIVREIGRGGMAIVYEARDPNVDRVVAVKVLPPAFTHDLTFRMRFEREAKTIATLEHSAIVPIYDYGEDGYQPFIVMRYMEGGSLAERLRRGPLPFVEIQRILDRVAAGIDFAHARGVIHRDLKPENFLFDGDDQPCIVDFGIAKLLDHAAVSLTRGGLIGTPAYMSPEHARGERIDTRTDLYSLGAILFEMLTGRTPYQAETPTGIIMRHLTDPIPRLVEARQDLPAQLQSVIDRSMAKRPQDRLASAGEVARLFSELARDASPPPTQIRPPIAPVAARPGVLAAPNLPVSPAQASFGQRQPASRLTLPGTGTRPPAGSSATGMRAAVAQPTLPVRGSQRSDAPVRRSVLSPWLLLASMALIITLGGLGVAALALSTPACHRVNPFDLETADLRKLGCPDGESVGGRRYQTQSFVGGLMILFEVGGQGPGFAGERLYVLANDLRAWQVSDTWRDPGGEDQRRLYTCRSSDKRPEDSGVPWRSFGRAWCANPAIQSALGAVIAIPTDGLVRGDGEYLQYENGRAFRVGGVTYLVYAPNRVSDVEGIWERR